MSRGRGASLDGLKLGLVALAVLLVCAGPASGHRAIDYTVTTTADSGAGSLRMAIQNANGSSDFNHIYFAIAGAGVHTIMPASSLPALTGPVDIDGTSQAGYAGTPLIQLDGSSLCGSCAVLFATAPVTLQGLNIVSSPFAGLYLDGKATVGSVIQDNYVGTNATGTAAAGNDLGVLLRDTVNVTVQRNLVSGNTCGCSGGYGILVTGKKTKGNVIRDNIVGLNAAGTAAIPNSKYGIYIQAPKNVVGGPLAADGNVVSGNGDIGIVIIGFVSSSKSKDVLVQNNLVGTNPAGTVARPNVNDGMIVSGSDSIRVLDNVLSGNGDWGVEVLYSKKTVLGGNRVGTNAAGSAAIGNGAGGIHVFQAPATRITEGPSGPTIASGNTGDGILVSVSPGTVIEETAVGTDVTAGSAIPNTGDGIHIADSVGKVLVRFSVASGNTGDGIHAESPGNKFLANRVGLDGPGTTAVPNGTGIRLQGLKNLIGGFGGLPTIVSGNTGHGIVIQSPGGDTIMQTGVGFSEAFPTTIPNGGSGIEILSANNVIGGKGGANAVVGNTGTGIRVSGGSANGNQIIGNLIGRIGPAAAGNGVDGVWVLGGDNNLVQRNQIGNNVFNGVSVSAGGTGNRVLANSILANGDWGIDLEVNGVTPNDAGDPDGGSNFRQNYPVISGYVVSPGKVQIGGTLNSTPNTSFTVDFFWNTACDGSGFGEGEFYLGSKKVKTNGAGNGSFSVKLKSSSAPSNITATATDPGGNTSEFSACVP